MDITNIFKDILNNSHLYSSKTNNSFKLMFLGFNCELNMENGKFTELPFDVNIDMNTEVGICKIKMFLVNKLIRYNLLSYKDDDREKCPFYIEYLKFLRKNKINNILSENIR